VSAYDRRSCAPRTWHNVRHHRAADAPMHGPLPSGARLGQAQRSQILSRVLRAKPTRSIHCAILTEARATSCNRTRCRNPPADRGNAQHDPNTRGKMNQAGRVPAAYCPEEQAVDTSLRQEQRRASDATALGGTACQHDRRDPDMRKRGVVLAAVRTLRAAYGDSPQAVLTATPRDAAEREGRDGETALDLHGSEKPRFSQREAQRVTFEESPPRPLGKDRR
jgi:hypothetical protein